MTFLLGFAAGLITGVLLVVACVYALIRLVRPRFIAPPALSKDDILAMMGARANAAPPAHQPPPPQTRTTGTPAIVRPAAPPEPAIVVINDRAKETKQ